MRVRGLHVAPGTRVPGAGPSSSSNAVGDVEVLPLGLDAASRSEKRPSDAEMEEIAERQAMEPLFARADVWGRGLRACRTWG